MNLPNKISLARIAMIPVFILVFFLKAIPYNYVIAAVIFLLAAATDFIDGYIARSRGLVTNLGKFLDPIADKVLVASAFILLLAAKDDIFGELGRYLEIVYIGVAVSVCLIMARELIISAFRQIAATNGIVMAAEKLGKYKTATQDACIFFLIFAGSFSGTFGRVVLAIGLVLFAAATILTVISGVSYVWKYRVVLKDSEK